MPFAKPTSGGVIISVSVRPRSSRDEVSGELDGRLKIKLKAPPVDGEANEALTKFLAKRLGVPRSSVTILRGSTSKNKEIRIEGASVQEIEKLLIGG